MKYWAFLSYSHADAAAAAKLHRALEHYTLPGGVRRAHNLPKRLIPVFRDQDELEAAADLTSRLRAALDDSRWLIVLCTPATARSNYVNDEIEYFLERHGPQKLLCVLLDGEPPDSFPPAVRALADEPLAADLRPGASFAVCVLKLIAAMAMVGYAELRNREAQRRQRRGLLAAAALTGIGATSLAYWDLFQREQVDYHAGYVREHGIWHGVDRISAAVAARREDTYRFHRRGRLQPPYRVDIINGAGECTLEGLTDILGQQSGDSGQFRNRRFCSAAFDYARDGSIRAEILLNMFGQPLESLTYTQPDLAQFTLQGFALANARSGIYYVQFERDGYGRDAALRFLRSRGHPRPNDARAFGYRLAYDGAGHETQRSTLDADGHDIGDVVRREYSPEGFLTREIFQDNDGTPRRGPDGAASFTREYDAAGNLLSVSSYGQDGQPALNARHWAVARYRYDAQGNRVQEDYFDETGKPTWDAHSANDGAEQSRWQYDTRGNQIRLESHAADGRLVPGRSGSAIYAFTYNDRNLLADSTEMNADGEPALNWGGFAINRFHYDDRGNMVDQEFLGPDGRRVQTRWGSRIKLKFDERGNVIEFSFFDEHDHRFLRRLLGAAVIRVSRDERGNAVEVRNLGTDLQPVLSDYGYTSRRMTYDDFGNQVEQRFYDAGDHLVAGKAGYAVQRSSHDGNGNEIRRRYFGPDARPAALADDGFGWDADYDSRGRVTRRVYVDSQGRPSAAARGYAAVRYEYGAADWVRAEHYEDEHGAPTPAATLLFTAGPFDREIERHYQDAAGHTVSGPEGYAVLRTQRDRFGNELQESCFDAVGNPVNRRDTGWSVKKTLYRHGYKADEQYFDANGKQVQVAP